MGKIKNIRVEWHAKTKKLSQIPKEGLEYAFVSEDFKQIHQLVWCKDFLQDAIFGHLNQKEAKIYGFSYNPETMLPLHMSKTRMLITNWKDEDFGPKLLKNCLPFMHAIEKRLKMVKTEVFRCEKVPARYKKAGVYMLESSSRWMKSPPLISLYTFLLRAGMVHKKKQSPLTTITKIGSGDMKSYYGGDGHQGADDKNIANGSKKGIKFILKHGDRKVFHRDIMKNYPESCSTSKIHDSFGIRGFSQGGTKKQFPHWHKLEKNK